MNLDRLPKVTESDLKRCEKYREASGSLRAAESDCRPVNKHSGGEDFMKKAQRLFIMLFIFQILLNCCSTFWVLKFSMFIIILSTFPWLVFLRNRSCQQHIPFIFSVKAKSKVIIFMFIYWYIALFTQYNHLYMILPLSFLQSFYSPAPYSFVSKHGISC